MLVVAAAVAVLAAGVGRAGDRPARSCAVKGARTVLATGKLNIYRLPSRTRPAPLYGCIAGVGKRIRLDSPDDDAEPETAVIAVGVGRYAAVALEFVTPGTETVVSIEVTDLRSGKRHSAAALPPYEGPAGDRVRALVLNGTGAAAWIAVNETNGAPTEGLYVIRAQSAGGEPALELDSGRDIVPRSLALSADGRTLYWQKADRARGVAMP
jgi:hypothetical protein